tara:strand:+ start:6989 stop:7471 length:483 start_codon:yes stop_codon:yes gene_type:complete
MKNFFYLILLCPIFLFGQQTLSLGDILTIDSKEAFLKVAIENGYSEGNTNKEKIYYGKGFKGDKSQATDWAEYTLDVGEFYFEQSDLSYVRKHSKKIACYYDMLVSEIKDKCEYQKIMIHDSKKNGEVNFSTYKCANSKFKGNIGFAQVDGNGIIQEFPQ